MASRIVELIFGREKRQRLTVATASVPDGVRVYAVGDLHGRVDLLERLHGLIREDAAGAAPGIDKIIVYLGDYVDRGLHSRELLDLLIDRPLAGFEAVHLRGNHDQCFLDFLVNPESGAAWLSFGGDATVYSYGVSIPDRVPPDRRLLLLRDRLLESVPERHLAFLGRLEPARIIGDFLFVHAGVNPDRPLHRQTSHDLMWIREAFLESERDFGKIVVHGHSVSERPDVRDNRIGIDTGACYGNSLTCLVLEGTDKRFLFIAEAAVSDTPRMVRHASSS
ncbi:MAG: metallophosphoesterase [Rhodospirillales bacterium]